MKKILLAALLSVAFHVVLPLAETSAERHGWSFKIIDTVVFFPGEVFGSLMPPGHGIPQLVLPFVFSIAFYAVVFWILLTIYERQHRKVVGESEKGTSSHQE